MVVDAVGAPAGGVAVRMDREAPRPTVTPSCPASPGVPCLCPRPDPTRNVTFDAWVSRTSASGPGGSGGRGEEDPATLVRSVRAFLGAHRHWREPAGRARPGWSSLVGVSHPPACWPPPAVPSASSALPASRRPRLPASAGRDDSVPRSRMAPQPWPSIGPGARGSWGRPTGTSAGNRPEAPPPTRMCGGMAPAASTCGRTRGGCPLPSRELQGTATSGTSDIPASSGLRRVSMQASRRAATAGARHANLEDDRSIGNSRLVDRVNRAATALASV